MPAGASLGDWLGLAAADNDALATSAGDRWIASWAGLPVISRLDRTVCTSHPGNGRRPLSGSATRNRSAGRMASRTSAQPSQQSLALTLTLDRVAHIKCCHCYLRSLHNTEK